ncbi:U3 small nucleolar RNA-associated protein 6 [Nematocida major]|uniref:U3 small nucleolar RNA-associated protein 6 n=1 Tax=Nematocida major TaxID=1912982 RepID=UPI002007BB43|nr:U3 small nucleolar RNA-associated protein 6 [Nematocida major]KAH9386725.1 U3 small nucleolar RNA-associated protein 6 [Nematocida major]
MTHAVVSEMEYMVPELSYYKSRAIFKQEEIQAIVRKRKSFEEMLATNPRFTIFLLYIEYEVMLQRIYAKRAKKVHSKRDYIKSRIDSLYKRAQFKYPDSEELRFSHLEYFIHIGDKAKIKEHALELPKKHAGSQKAWTTAANALRSVGDVENSRILMQKALRVAPCKKDMLNAYIKMEESHAQKDSEKILEILRKHAQIEA